MSKSSKIWTVIIVVVIVIILWLLLASSGNKPVSPIVKQPAMPSNVIVKKTNSAPANTSDIINPADTSDASLNQDMNAVNSQLNNLNTDSSNIDQSLK